jgi:hypothetical protein
MATHLKFPPPATMTPKAITSALAAAQALFLPINGQLYNTILSVSPTPSCLSFSRPPTTMSMASTTIGDLLPMQTGTYTTTALLLYALPPIWHAMTRQSMWKLFASTVFTPKPPGPPRLKTTWPMRPLSVASMSSLRLLCMIPRFATFKILRHFSQMLQPLPSLTIFASVPAVYTRWTLY